MSPEEFKLPGSAATTLGSKRPTQSWPNKVVTDTGQVSSSANLSRQASHVPEGIVETGAL